MMIETLPMTERAALFEALRELDLLLVEDDELIRDSLSLYLENEGCRLIALETAEQGLAELKRQRYDIVITDVRLPGMDGIEFLRHVQEIQPDLQKVLLTAYMSEEVLAEAFRLGVHAFVEKPFSTEDIEEALARLLEKRLRL